MCIRDSKYAYNAAHAVAEGSGLTYNPLFIYGQPGLGKTHLLYAIAHRVRQLHPDYNIQYLKSEDFVNELIGYLRLSLIHIFVTSFLRGHRPPRCGGWAPHRWRRW